MKSTVDGCTICGTYLDLLALFCTGGITLKSKSVLLVSLCNSCDNCHSHVANALNRMPIKAPITGTWNMIVICFYIFFRARFLSWTGMLLQFGPFLFLLMIILLTKITY
jgi:Protein of unknown function (DUF778)